MILIDTTLLKELVAISSAANEAVDNAVNALNQITVHNDWGCREKNAINDYTISNRNKIRQLQDDSRNFLNAISEVTNEFETSEKSIIELFPSVETLLSDIFGTASSAIINGHTGTPAPGTNNGFSEIIMNWLNDNRITGTWGDLPDPLKLIEKQNLTEPIAICRFDDITL